MTQQIHCGGYENKNATDTLFSFIYGTVKNYSTTKQVNISLPGMTGVQDSGGGENWCDYHALDRYCDAAAIVSRGMA
jgi:hypothetical protein